MYSPTSVTSIGTSKSLVIRVARIALPNCIGGPHEVTCQDGLITSIASITDRFEDILLAPGFVDIQVNGIGRIDVSGARDDDWPLLDHALLEQGVTTWLPTLISAPLDGYARKFSSVIAAKQRSNTLRPDIAGVHVEGPFLGDALGAHDPRFASATDPAWFKQIPDIVRIVTLAPENPVAMEAISALRNRNIVVAVGHSRASDETTLKAIDLGVQLVTHLFNGMSGIHHRGDGVALIALTDERVAFSLIADLVHVQPRAIALAFRAKPHAVVLITDSIAVESESAVKRGIRIVDGGPRLPDGTLAGSSLTMIAAIKNVVEECAIDLHLAIQAATLTPARLLGLVDRGSLAVGQRADFVTLDQHFAVHSTWVGGQLAFSRH